MAPFSRGNPSHEWVERRTGVRPRVHLAWTSEETSGEDRMTVAYLMDTVVQAGYEAIELIVEDIVLDDGDGRFYDQQGRHLDVVFRRHGLEAWEYDVMAALRRSGPPYELTAGELLAALMITSGAVTLRRAGI